MSDCQACGAPCGDNAKLCRTHTSELAAGLREVTWIVPELETTITRQDKLGVTSETKSTGETPLNWNDRASIIAVDLNSILNAWALEVSRMDEDERDPLAGIHHSDTSAVADWLRRNLTTLVHHEEAHVARDEIRNSVDRAKGAIDRPKNRTSFYVGPCPEMQADHEAEHCLGDVWAFIPTSETESAWLRCQEPICGAAWNTTQWFRVGGRIRNRMKQLGMRDPWPLQGAA